MLRRAALVLMLLACSRQKGPPASQGVDASLHVDASPGSSPDASAAALAPVLPLPAAVPGTDPERVRIAASLCAASYFRSPVTQKLEVGCVYHPPFDKPDQRPNGRLTEHTGDPLAFCGIDEVFHGSFSRPGAKEAIVAFSQCKESGDATWDMGFPGSAILVEEAGDRWRQVAYRDGLNLGPDCKRARARDGHEVLVCDSSFLAGMSGELAYVFVVDFSQAERTKTLAKLYSFVFDCSYGGTLPDGFSLTALKGVALADANGDGFDDIVVTATRSRLAPSPKVDARVTAACAMDPSGAFPVTMPPATTTKLVFLADAAGFTADAATARTLARWQAEDPQGYRGIDSIAP